MRCNMVCAFFALVKKSQNLSYFGGLITEILNASSRPLRSLTLIGFEDPGTLWRNSPSRIAFSFSSLYFLSIVTVVDGDISDI